MSIRSLRIRWASFSSESRTAECQPLQDALRSDTVRSNARLNAGPDATLDEGRDAGNVQHEAEDDDRAEEDDAPRVHKRGRHPGEVPVGDELVEEALHIADRLSLIA